MAGRGVKLNRNGTEHDRFFIIDIPRYTEARRFMRHDVVAPELLSQGETRRDVVCVGVGRNGVNKVQTLFFDEGDVGLQKVVNGVNKCRLLCFFIDDEVGHAHTPSFNCSNRMKHPTSCSVLKVNNGYSSYTVVMNVPP